MEDDCSRAGAREELLVDPVAGEVAQTALAFVVLPH